MGKTIGKSQGKYTSNHGCKTWDVYNQQTGGYLLDLVGFIANEWMPMQCLIRYILTF